MVMSSSSAILAPRWYSVASVRTCPSSLAGADVAAKASRAPVPGSGGQRHSDRRPYASPRGGVGVARDLTDANRFAGFDSSQSDAALLTPMVSSIEWELRVSGSAVTEAWDWQLQGSPPVRLLESVRMLRASRRARHIPVTAFSMTNGDHFWLESGLESMTSCAGATVTRALGGLSRSLFGCRGTSPRPAVTHRICSPSV
jgi:hypothetical protein